MARRRPHERSEEEGEAVTVRLLRAIGELNPYADASPDDVEQRLRNMNYGATNSRISKLRRAHSDRPADR
jgi:hypothetical protein